MRMNSYIRLYSVLLCSELCVMCSRICISLKKKTKKKRKNDERGAYPVLLAWPRCILAPFRRSRRGKVKVKAHDPIQRWDNSFQVCSQLLLYLKNAGVATPGSNLRFTDQTFVSFAPHLVLRIKPLYRVV